ncbi:MAG: hypothetical protein IJ310_05655 [Clostridia bacterium]|nr:hypothetical protein [Clostridia bacterium]
MNKNFKKIAITTVLSVASLSAIGCGQTNKISNKNLTQYTNEASSNLKNYANKKEANTSQNQFGKIVSAAAYNEQKYISPKQTSSSIENSISSQSPNEFGFRLYILSNMPFTNITTEDSNLNNTNQTTQTSNEQMNELNLKRSVLMIYVNEIQNGNVNLTQENKDEINRQIEIINQKNVFKNSESTTYNLPRNSQNQNENISSTISAVDSILNIIETNLTSSSKYYQTNLSQNYGSFVSNTNESNICDDNCLIAQNIAKSLNMKISQNDKNITNQNNNISTLDENYTNNQNTQNRSNISANQLNNNNLNTINQRNYIQNQTNQSHLTKDIKENNQTTNRVNQTTSRASNQSSTDTNQNTSRTNQNSGNTQTDSNILTRTNTPRTIRANRYPERNSAANTSNSTNLSAENNAVRVPYRATNI